MDCSLPGSSVHGILWARILEQVTIFSSRGSSRPRDETHISCIGRCVLYQWATREACTLLSHPLSFTGLSPNTSVRCLLLSQYLLLGLPPCTILQCNQLIPMISADPGAGQNRCHQQPQTTGLEWDVASPCYKWIAFYLQPILGGVGRLLPLAAAVSFHLIPVKLLIFLEKRLLKRWFPWTFRGNSGD